MDPHTRLLFSIVGVILVIASLIGAILSQRCRGDAAAQTVANLNARIRSWWVMAAVFSATILLGPVFTTLLFALLSFLAMREFITLNRTERADHEILFWAFFVILPLHYFLVGIHWYGLFAIFIPGYAFIFIPFRRVLTGETKAFLQSTARIQWALLICVYAVSHMPMLSPSPSPDIRVKMRTCSSFLSSPPSSAMYSSMSGARLAGNTPSPPPKPSQDPGGNYRRDRLDRAREYLSVVGDSLQSLASSGDGSSHLPRRIFRRSRPLRHQA